MKKTLLPLILSSAFFFASCSANNSSSDSKKDTEPKTDPDVVMTNFVNKINSNNYVIKIKDRSKMVMVDENQYYMDYIEAGIRDVAIFTINGNETFQATMIKDEIEDLRYVSNEKAADVTSDKNLKYFLSASGGNLMNLLYNDVENPLHFFSTENTREPLVEFFAPLFGYGPTAYGRIQDFQFTFDKEDMDTLHIFAEVEDDTFPKIEYEDIEVDVTFGNAESNKTISRWLERPILPEAQTEWSDIDMMAICSVFDQQYGEEVIPFPTFASYTFLLDTNKILNENILYITDKYATYEDSVAYITELINNGFSATKDYDEDGKLVTYYRKLLNSKYDYYSSIKLDFSDEGMVIVCKEHFKSDKYYNLNDINDLIMDKGYPYMVESDNILSWRAVDMWKEAKNATWYFYDYDMYLDVNIEYNDSEELNAYIDAYANKLVSKYNFTYLEGENYYQSEDGYYSFRWMDYGSGKAGMLFKHERKMSVQEIEQTINRGGFPNAGLSSKEVISVSGRDLIDNMKYLTNGDYETYLSVDLSFENNSKRDEFLDEYTSILENAGYTQTMVSDKGEYFYDDADNIHEVRFIVSDSAFVKAHFIK